MCNHRLKYKIDVIIISIFVFLYLLNRVFLKNITEGDIHWFLVCYWNDITGATAFSAYAHSIILRYSKQEINIWSLFALLLAFGLFWEILTPLFRKNSVCDFWDIVAYESGVVVYYMSRWLCEKHIREINTKCFRMFE